MLFLLLLAFTVSILPLLPYLSVWLVSRFFGGMAVAGIFVVVESWFLVVIILKSELNAWALYDITFMVAQHWVSLLLVPLVRKGQFLFIAVLALLLIAVLPPLFLNKDNPNATSIKVCQLKQISRLNKASLVGCMVSGVVMGSIYGMMPLAFKSGAI